MPADRYQLRCSLCKLSHGACIQCCAGRTCRTAFHPLCARLAGLPMQQLDVADESATRALADRLARCNHKTRVKKGQKATWAAEGCDVAGVRLLVFCARHAASAAPADDARGVYEDAGTTGVGLPLPPGFAPSIRGGVALSARHLTWLSLARRGLKQPDHLQDALIKRQYIQV